MSWVEREDNTAIPLSPIRLASLRCQLCPMQELTAILGTVCCTGRTKMRPAPNTSARGGIAPQAGRWSRSAGEPSHPTS